MKYKFSPKTDIIYNNDGILTTTENFSNEFKEFYFTTILLIHNKTGESGHNKQIRMS